MQSERSFELVLFDLGATLIYFDGDWEASIMEGVLAMRRRLHELGYPMDDRFAAHYRETAREYYRWRDDNLTETAAPEIFRRIMAEYCCDDLPEVHIREALATLYATTQARWRPEADAVPMLAELRRQGYRLGLVSNAGYDEDVQALVDQSGFRPYLEYVISSAAAGIRKPHPDIFEAALAYFGVPAARAVMVGDFLQADVLGANRLGMGSVWITRRADLTAAQPILKRIRPDRTIAALSELPGVLEDWDRSLLDRKRKTVLD
jgi:HAD superfamily hydrolase (TIGR01662 family)